MDIPDEVLESIHGCFEGYPVMMEDEVRAIVTGHARSAQVAVLRELSEDLLAQRDRLRSGTDKYRNASRQYGLEEAAQMARSKANELEAGAGQTGTTEREN